MPLEGVSQGFKDISASFKSHPLTNDAIALKNASAVARSVRNIVMTFPGEKPFQPTVGSKVMDMLFEPLDPFTADAVKDEIINTVNQYEPRVELTKVDVTAIPEGNKLNITLEYRIVGLPIVETIEFVLQRPE